MSERASPSFACPASSCKHEPFQTATVLGEHWRQVHTDHFGDEKIEKTMESFGLSMCTRCHLFFVSLTIHQQASKTCSTTLKSSNKRKRSDERDEMDEKHADRAKRVEMTPCAGVSSLDQLPAPRRIVALPPAPSASSASLMSPSSSSSSSSAPVRVARAAAAPVVVPVVPAVVPSINKCSEAVRQFAAKNGLPSPIEMGDHKRLMKWVPKTVKDSWRELCSVVLSRYVVADRAHDVEGKLRALVEFLLLPQRALVHAHGGAKRQQRDLRNQHRRALAEVLSADAPAASAASAASASSSSTSSSSSSLYREPLASQVRPPVDRDWSVEAAARARDAQVRRAVGLIRCGYIKRAARTLMQPITAPIPAEVLVAKMQELHPHNEGTPVPELPIDAPLVVCEANEGLARHLRKICNGSGPGESGMTFDHIKVLTSDQTCMDGLACIMRDVLNDRLDSRFKEYLLASRGLGIEKAGPPGSMRPIAIGEALYRAAVSFALYPCLAEAAKVLQPVNLGCGTEGGAEIVVACVQHFLRTRDVAVFVGDFRNAFNTVSRSSMMASLFGQPKLNRLWRVAHWAYSQSSLVLVRDRQGELATVLSSEQGVRQGDPLASLLFCLAVAGVYKTAAAAGKDVVPLAFMDDIHLIGAPEEVKKSAAVLEVEARKIGLELRPEKSKFVSFQSGEDLPVSVVAWLEQRKVQVFTSAAAAASGSGDSAVAEILGVPVSEDFKAVSDKVKSAVAEHKVFFDSLLHTSMPAMLAMLMLRVSGVPRMNYLTRCLPGECVLEGAKEFDNQVMETAVAKLKIPNDEVDAAKIRLAMPMNPVGGGLRSAAAMAPEAYLAAQAQAGPFLQKLTKGEVGPAPGSPSHVALVSAVASVLSFIPAREAYDGKEGKEQKEDPEEEGAAAASGIRSLLPPGRDADSCVNGFWKFFAQHKENIAGLQHRLTRLREQRELQRVEEKMSPASLALLRSSSQRGANLWCTAIPSSESSVLPDAHFITAMRVHLGLPLSAVLPSSCACGAPLSASGFHLLHCCRFRGSSVSLRHHRLVRVLASYARQAGAVVEVEKVVDEDGRRIDLEVHFAESSSMVDVTVRDPTAAGVVRRAAAEAGAAARDAEADKEKVYGRLARAAGRRLFTFTMDVTGALSESAQQLVDLVVRHYQDGEEEPDPSFRQRLSMDLACALQRGNGDVVASGLASARAAESGRLGGVGRKRRWAA